MRIIYVKNNIGFTIMLNNMRCVFKKIYPKVLDRFKMSKSKFVSCLFSCYLN